MYGSGYDDGYGRYDDGYGKGGGKGWGGDAGDDRGKGGGPMLSQEELNLREYDKFMNEVPMTTKAWGGIGGYQGRHRGVEGRGKGG